MLMSESAIKIAATPLLLSFLTSAIRVGVHGYIARQLTNHSNQWCDHSNIAVLNMEKFCNCLFFGTDESDINFLDIYGNDLHNLSKRLKIEAYQKVITSFLKAA